MKHILTLTDFSPVAENAVEVAFMLARKFNTDLSIYHNSVDGDLIMYELVGDPEIEHFTLSNSIRTAPISTWKALAKKYNVTARYLTGSADFIKKIFDITAILEIDLIVMGSSGAGGRKGLFWGSNTEKLVKHVDVPVLVIKETIKDLNFKNIVFASSFDAVEKDVLKFALDLVQAPDDTKLHLLCVDISSFFTQPMALMRAAMKEFEKAFSKYDVKSYFYKDYSIQAGIRHFVEEIEPDLLIMSNKNKKPVKRFFKGNDTLKAINYVDFPVLSIDYHQVLKDA